MNLSPTPSAAFRSYSTLATHHPFTPIRSGPLATSSFITNTCRISPSQPLYHQHLHILLVSVASTGLITTADATLTQSTPPNPFTSNTYEKHGGTPLSHFLPLSDSRSRETAILYVPSFHALPLSFAHSCTSKKPKPLVFMQFHTLAQKHHGVGYPRQPSHLSTRANHIPIRRVTFAPSSHGTQITRHGSRHTGLHLGAKEE
jgi:hypothetical protein